jgi:hypothetical protein
MLIIPGFDISNHQDDMNVEAVARANGFRYCFILTNDGTVVNHYFHQQADAAERAGAIVRPYVYLRPNVQQTIDIHTSIVQGRYDDSIVDVEEGSGGWNEVWRAHNILWEREFETSLLYWPNFHWSAMGRPDLSPLRRSDANPLGVKGHWKSWYPDRNYEDFETVLAKVPQYVWSDNRGGIPVCIVQITGTGKVEGYGGHVDLNAFAGTIEELAELLGDEVPDMDLDTPVPLYDHNTGKGEIYPYKDAIWGTHFHAKEADLTAKRIEVQLAAQAGALAEHETRMLASIRAMFEQYSDDVVLTDEQIQELIAQFPPAVDRGLRDFYGRAVELSDSSPS